ncbi:MAG TPA: hypothetical protein VGN83_09995 [Falsiroseomonas sp.]|jgi:hypothetical protein|nr:hypothetical protein [Falsiroseomonas sp.]
MRIKTDADKTEMPSRDQSALLMMLAYVEAECRRLGAEAAAEHAAMAAALVTRPAAMRAELARAIH